MKRSVIPAFLRGASDTAEARIPLRFIPAHGLEHHEVDHDTEHD